MAYTTLNKMVTVFINNIGFSYKPVFGLIDLNLSDFFILRSDDRSWPYKLFLHSCSSSARHNFYTYRAAKIWNYLPADFSSLNSFYHAMHFSAKRGIAIVYCLSVRLSVTLRYVFHTGWNSSKIISRPNSLRPLLELTPTWAIWCNGNTPKIRVE